MDVLKSYGYSNEGNQVEAVVLNMIDGMENKRHVVVIDNYFTSVGLFKKLFNKGIYETRTFRNNYIGLLLQLSETKEFNKNIQGTLDWRMHDSRELNCIAWKNKISIFLLSTHKPNNFGRRRNSYNVS
jgi:hypothetical protein